VMAAAASGAGCSEPPGRCECVLVDPIRNATLKIAMSKEAGRVRTLGEALSYYRSTDVETPDAADRGDPSPDIERRRFADGLFLLTAAGTLGELIPGLRFQIGGRACELDHRLDGEGAAG